MMGLCLVAAFALTAIGAGTASALPEVGRCVAQAGTGKYKDANCTKKAGSLTSEKQFEWKKGAKSETEGVHFTSAGGEGVLETVSGTKVVCKTQSATGKYDQDSGVIKEVEGVVASFQGCELPIISASCQTVGQAAGVIITKNLKGPLGYISGAKTTSPIVGQELTPETAKGKFAEFECGGGAVKILVKGKEGAAAEGRTGGNCIIAPVKNANEMSLTAEQVYSGSAGVQNPQHFQDIGTAKSKFCNLESNANGGAFEAATQALTTTVTGEEALEVKA
jgi:hypothetical protein